VAIMTWLKIFSFEPAKCCREACIRIAEWMNSTYFPNIFRWMKFQIDWILGVHHHMMLKYSANEDLVPFVVLQASEMFPQTHRVDTVSKQGM
jgi:hypothetical protein